MLEAIDLSVTYGTGRTKLKAVDRVSFSVPPGGTIGIVGESGSGKSTIARGVMGLVELGSGRLLLDGADFTSAGRRRSPDFRRVVQPVFQDPFASLNPRMSVGEMMREAVGMRSNSRRVDRTSESIRVLSLVGIDGGMMSRYPHQFSGGQRQRLAIARALAIEPKVILMDEVTSALDVSVQASILNLLNDLQRELGLSYLMISHDLSVISAISDTVAVMYLGQIVEYSDAQSLFRNSQHPYTRALIQSIPQFGVERSPAPLSGRIPDAHDPPPGCRFHTRCPVGPRFQPERTICVEQDPQESAQQRAHRAACHFAPTTESNGVESIEAPVTAG